MSKFVCKYCGMSVPVYKRVGPHMGEWCHFCGKWQRWVPQKEKVFDDDEVEVIKAENKRRYVNENIDDEVPW